MEADESKYTYNYSLEGVFTIVPMFITKVAKTEEEARAAALAEIGPTGTIHGKPEVVEAWEEKI